MALDLKPLTDDVIQTMGYTSRDLWLVKIDAEIFGPFELASLKDYAAENEKEFTYAHAQFVSLKAVEDRYWILEKGQKVGPLTMIAVQKKIELGALTMSDMVSTDEGHSWSKILQNPTFNPGFVGGVDSLPSAPTDSSFVKAKEELTERMDSHDRTGSYSGLANLMNLIRNKENEKPVPKLEEMDLKSLDETEVSRSLKWAIPSAVAAIALIAAVGNYLLTPGTVEMVQAEESVEVIRPKAVTRATTPSPRGFIANRAPANYNPTQITQRSALTTAPTEITNAYPAPAVIEQHVNEPDLINEQLVENNGEQAPEEHSLVSKPVQVNPAMETLDQSMSGGGVDEAQQPIETPVVEEATDF